MLLLLLNINIPTECSNPQLSHPQWWFQIARKS